jgi:galactokinase
LTVLHLRHRFTEQFNEPPIIVRSPGRINLLGEHTDYNEGFVLPGAIDRAAFVAVSRRGDDKIVLESVDFNERFETHVFSLKRVAGWPDYVLGVAHQLLKRRYPIGGFNLMLTSNVPVGAGLSSSAAVECAVAFALNTLFGLNIERMDLAKIGQQAEHEFAGTLCGLMDQFASLFGKKDQVIQLDCRSLAYQYLPFDFPDVEIVLLDSGVKHALASSEYNTRRKECEEGVSLISQQYPFVKSLRDANLQMLGECLSPGSLIYNRCRYVIEENDRLLIACTDLNKKDIVAFGKAMFQTHDGLRDLYEVSCKELDFLVDRVRSKPEVFGARMMGGGFGGCTINLVERAQADGLIKEVAEAFERAFEKTLTVYRVQLHEGTSVMES